jgi:ABC-2 type transport system permease protein
MSKIWLIAGREYITRVRKKTFILATILTPVGIGLMMLAMIDFMKKGGEANKHILVKDESGIIADAGELNTSTLTYELVNDPLDSLKANYAEQNGDILVVLPRIDSLSDNAYQLRYYSEEKLSLGTIDNIEDAMAEQFKDKKIATSDISMDTYKSFDTDIDLENGEMLDQIAAGEEPKSTGKTGLLIGTMLGGLMGFMMYMVIFVYGGMVMRSVMEEKINRIVEIMISSVKPVQLMLGKILGVGGVGLTQLGIWLILVPAILFGVQYFMGGDVPMDAAMGGADVEAMTKEFDLSESGISEYIKEFKALNWFLIIPVFVLFFFGGYFIYASLFAAVGSATGDDMGESQQLMIPISMPVIIAFMMLQPVLDNPNGNMAIFGSMFPLISPIIMPARLAFDPPMWQVGLSILILILSCIFFAWIAGRIYRVGILMYGKKVNIKEIGKWLFYKD